MVRNRVSRRMSKDNDKAEGTAAERATKSLEEAKGKPVKSQAEAEDKSREELVPVTELGLAPSKSTGQLVPDTQTGVMAAQAVDPETGKNTGKVTITIENEDEDDTEFTADLFEGGDLQSTFNGLKSQLDDFADKKSRKQSTTTGRAMANTTGVTQDNFENTPEAKGRPTEVFLTDGDRLRAEVAAQNEAKKAPEKKADKKADDKAEAKK